MSKRKPSIVTDEDSTGPDLTWHRQLLSPGHQFKVVTEKHTLGRGEHWTEPSFRLFANRAINGPRQWEELEIHAPGFMGVSVDQLRLLSDLLVRALKEVDK
jgi:hypothetical protein